MSTGGSTDVAASPGSPPRARLATLALVAVTTIWGSTFVLIKHVVDSIPVLDFLAVRFVIAAVLMLALFGRRAARLSRGQLERGLGLGVVYGIAQILQTEGLARTSASVSGFVTGTYVVLTPILGLLLLRQRVGAITWVAVALSTVGLGVLSLHGAEVSTGVLLILAASVLYACHILGLGLWSSGSEALELAAVQSVGIALVCVTAAVPHGIVLPHGGPAWVATLYLAAIAGALTLILQTWAQAHLSSTRAAIVMTLEPVAAAAFAVGFGEPLTGRMVVGGIMVLAAMYAVELVPKREGSCEDSPPPEFLHHET